MDPDRGVLYFSNMLNGIENCITEIQVNRSKVIKDRGGYGSLFDSTPHEKRLLSLIEKKEIKPIENIVKKYHVQYGVLYVYFDYIFALFDQKGNFKNLLFCVESVSCKI